MRRTRLQNLVCKSPLRSAFLLLFILLLGPIQSELVSSSIGVNLLGDPTCTGGTIITVKNGGFPVTYAPKYGQVSDLITDNFENTGA